jgi:hypothetical protein
MKKIFCCGGIILCCAWSVFAQSFGSVDNDKADSETVIDERKGFTAQVDIDTNLFQATQTEYSDADKRYGAGFYRTNSFLIDNYPLGGFNVLDDTNVAFGYTGEWYGGNLSVNKDGLGGVKAWLGFLNNKIKITAGNDIGYGYADSQGADAGLRVYDDNVRNNSDTTDDETVDSNKNPDNITQDKGLLIEFDLDPLKIAIAGSGNITDLAENMGSVISASNNEPIYGHNFQYGANIGYKMGEIAKVNGSYIMQAVKDKDKYEFNTRANKIIARFADAETLTHLFGVYASVYPFGNDSLGITAGYAGVYIKYLDEFNVESKTAIPQVFKNGVNLTARYKTDKLTIKTDHNLSFWTDKNYSIYNWYKPAADKMIDYGLEPTSNDNSTWSDVTHFFLWNGIGASYKFTSIFEGSVYARNLLREDKTDKYNMTIMYTSLELKSTFHISPNVEAYAGVTWHYTGRNTSESLAADSGEFSISNSTPTATYDFVNMIQIPVGFTVKLQ